MIRNKFMKFAPKEKSSEKNRKQLEKTNVPVYEGPRPTKFGAFSSLAQDIKQKKGKGVEGYDGTGRSRQQDADKVYQHQQNLIYGSNALGRSDAGAGSSNPYAISQPMGNPYANTAANSNQNPYSQKSNFNGKPGKHRDQDLDELDGPPTTGPASYAPSLSNPYGASTDTAANGARYSQNQGPTGLRDGGYSAGRENDHFVDPNGPNGPGMPGAAADSNIYGSFGGMGAPNGYTGSARPNASDLNPTSHSTEPPRPSRTRNQNGGGSYGNDYQNPAGAEAGADSYGMSAPGYGVHSDVHGRSMSDPYTGGSHDAQDHEDGASLYRSSTSTQYGWAAGYRENDTGNSARNPKNDIQLDDGYDLARVGTTQSQTKARNDLFTSNPSWSQYEANTESHGGAADDLNDTPSVYNAPYGSADLNAPMSSSEARADLDELNRIPTIAEEGDEYDDLNAPPSIYEGKTRGNGVLSGRQGEFEGIQEEDEGEYDELNQPPDEQGNQYGDYYDDQGYGMYQRRQLADSEDEDVEDVKNEIRFVKKETVQSTRNALRLASEAETSGRNTMGMLGWQGEKLANTEANLSLTNQQTKIAHENTNELRRLNRSIFLPNISNKFNARRRFEEKEARIRSELLQDQVARERMDEMQRRSEQRVSEGLNGSIGESYSEMASRRIRQEANKESEERRRYQFEADSEDDEMEDEIDENLDALHDASKRLHNLALQAGDEVDDQNKRIERLGRDVDRLDVDIHINTTRMATIR